MMASKSRARVTVSPRQALDDLEGTRTAAVKAVVAAARKLVQAAHDHPACLRHAMSGSGGCVEDCPPHLIADLSNALITLDRRQGK